MAGNDVWSDRAKLIVTLGVGTVIALFSVWFQATVVTAKLDEGNRASVIHNERMAQLSTAFALHDRASNDITMKLLKVVTVMCNMNAKGDPAWTRECNQ